MRRSAGGTRGLVRTKIIWDAGRVLANPELPPLTLVIASHDRELFGLGELVGSEARPHHIVFAPDWPSIEIVIGWNTN